MSAIANPKDTNSSGSCLLIVTDIISIDSLNAPSFIKRIILRSLNILVNATFSSDRLRKNGMIVIKSSNAVGVRAYFTRPKIPLYFSSSPIHQSLRMYSKIKIVVAKISTIEKSIESCVRMLGSVSRIVQITLIMIVITNVDETNVLSDEWNSFLNSMLCAADLS